MLARLFLLKDTGTNCSGGGPSSKWFVWLKVHQKSILMQRGFDTIPITTIPRPCLKHPDEAQPLRCISLTAACHCSTFRHSQKHNSIVCMCDAVPRHLHTWSHITENANAMRETSLCLILIHSGAQRVSVQGCAALRPFSQISTLSCSAGVHPYLLTSDAATALHQPMRLACSRLRWQCSFVNLSDRDAPPVAPPPD